MLVAVIALVCALACFLAVPSLAQAGTSPLPDPAPTGGTSPDPAPSGGASAPVVKRPAPVRIAPAHTTTPVVAQPKRPRAVARSLATQPISSTGAGRAQSSPHRRRAQASPHRRRAPRGAHRRGAAGSARAHRNSGAARIVAAVRFADYLHIPRLVAQPALRPGSDALLIPAAIALFLVVVAGASVVRLAVRLR
jgi:hypothetical protein